MPLDKLQSQRLIDRVSAELRDELSSRLAPGLHLVATPIGNLADISLRAISVIARADTLYCEDTRHTSRLLSRFGIDRRAFSYHEHNAERERPRILARLAENQSIALVSDAGTPLISDPGYKLVRDVISAGHAVTAIPGPSAVLAALASAGLPTDSFVFGGFLPPRSAARRNRITELSATPGTLVLFESPNRVAATLADLADLLGSRPAVVARELTKIHETLHRDDVKALANWATDNELRGECVILVGPQQHTTASNEDVLTALQAELEANSVRDAVATVAKRLGLPRTKVYNLAIQMKQATGNSNEDDAIGPET